MRPQHTMTYTVSKRKTDRIVNGRTVCEYECGDYFFKDIDLLDQGVEEQYLNDAAIKAFHSIYKLKDVRLIVREE